MLLSYWKQQATEHRLDPLAKDMIANLSRKYADKIARNDVATDIIESGAYSLRAQSIVGTEIPVEVMYFLLQSGPSEGVEEHKEEQPPTGRKQLSEEHRRLLQLHSEELVDEAVRKGMILDFMRPHSKVKLAEIEKHLVMLEGIDHGNSLPYALLLASSSTYRNADDVDGLQKLRMRVAKYFRQHGYIENGEGDFAERTIPGVVQLDKNGEDRDDYESAGTIEKFAEIIERYSSLQGITFLKCYATADNSRVVVFRST